MKYNCWDKVNLLLKIFYLWLFLFLFPYPTWLNDLVLVISKAIYYRRIRCSKHAFLVRRKSYCSMLVFQILLWKKIQWKGWHIELQMIPEKFLFHALLPRPPEKLLFQALFPSPPLKLLFHLLLPSPPWKLLFHPLLPFDIFVNRFDI